MLFPRQKPSLLSIVIPMYNEQEVFPYLKRKLMEIKPTLGVPVEFVLVDDGSRDETLRLAYEWANEDANVKLIVLSRNFGHQIALTAGLDHANGEAVVIIDADLQDPPELIPEMLKLYCDGYDVVYGQRIERQGESLFKNLTANMFYWLMKRMLMKDLPINAGDFRLISRDVLKDLNKIRESGRFMRGLTTWVGYNQIALPYKRPPRAAGKTKYPFLKMTNFALDAIFSFSDIPLRIITWIGMLSTMGALLMIIHAFYLFLSGNKRLVVGWASLIVVISFFSGIILISLGVMGKYIGRIYTESKRRPLYFVRKRINTPEPENIDAE